MFFAIPTAEGGGMMMDVCGDGVVTGDEECDDGMMPAMDGDGCSSKCKWECCLDESHDTIFKRMNDDMDDIILVCGCGGCITTDGLNNCTNSGSNPLCSTGYHVCTEDDAAAHGLAAALCESEPPNSTY